MMFCSNKGDIDPIYGSWTAIHPPCQCDMRSTHSDMNLNPSTLPAINVIGSFQLSQIYSAAFQSHIASGPHKQSEGGNAILGKLFV